MVERARTLICRPYTNILLSISPTNLNKVKFPKSELDYQEQKFSARDLPNIFQGNLGLKNNIKKSAFL